MTSASQSDALLAPFRAVRPAPAHALAVTAAAERGQCAIPLHTDIATSYTVYRLSRGAQVQTGVVGAASLAAYQRGHIRPHELTLTAAVAKCAAHVAAVQLHTQPALLLHRDAPALARLLQLLTTTAPPLLDVTTPDQVRHQLWPVTAAAYLAQLTAQLTALPCLYIADGHHRTAAAAQLAATRYHAPRFLAACFPAAQVQLAAVPRLITVAANCDPAALMQQCGAVAAVTPSDAPVLPSRAGKLGIYAAQRWYRVTRPPAVELEPLALTDAHWLQTQVLTPLLANADPCSEQRVHYPSGEASAAELMAAVDSGGHAGVVTLAALALTDVLALADAQLLLPPKSTWFTLKPAAGFINLRCAGAP